MSTDVVKQVDEMAERQRARLAEKSEENARAALKDAVVPLREASAPTVMRELRVRLMSDGNVHVEGPLNDPAAFNDLILQAISLFGQMREQRVRQATLAEVQRATKAPFMARILQGLRNKTRQ